MTSDIAADPNLAYLDALLHRLHVRLEVLVDGDASVAEPVARPDAVDSFITSMEQGAHDGGWTLRLPRLTRIFALDDFERDTLLLAAAPEIDPDFAEIIARAQHNTQPWPTVGLAWRLGCATTRESAVTRDSFRSDSPLLRFGLVHLSDEADPLPLRTLRADKRIADELTGRTMPDAALVQYLYAGSDPQTPPAGEANRLPHQLADRMRRFLRTRSAESSRLVFSLNGGPLADLDMLARQACALVGLPVLAVSATTLPPALAVTLIREAVLQPSALLIADADFDTVEGIEWARRLTDAGSITFLTNERAIRRPSELQGVAWAAIALSRLDVHGRKNVWLALLAPLGLNEAIAGDLASHFDLSEAAMRAALVAARTSAWLQGEELTTDDIAAACRTEVSHAMPELAQLLHPVYGWDDLLLPADAMAKLRELAGQAHVHERVLFEYGFDRVLPRGRGVTALFAGPSGVGKTMAAEVIARDLDRELYRVDLARVVSKYIGETEKNLRRIFIEAERARCVLFFDEADAIFGKRTEVRDSHDRYANIEVSYLLQLIEESEGAVVLLATNRRNAIDEAFLRRFRFIIDFPMPAADLRKQLWTRAFPPAVDVSAIRFDVLADRLPISGASIRNIAVAATYLAASDGGAVNAEHIAHAARRELEKIGRPAQFNPNDLLPLNGKAKHA